MVHVATTGLECSGAVQAVVVSGSSRFPARQMELCTSSCFGWVTVTVLVYQGSLLAVIDATKVLGHLQHRKNFEFKIL